jgi:hypothetical protein
MNAVLVLSLLSAAGPDGVVIERATISWSELERLLKREGAVAPKPSPRAPLAHSISRMEVSGEIHGARAELQVSYEVEVLAKGWTLVPLIPRNFAVSSASVTSSQRGILVRDAAGVSLAAKGEGQYRVEVRLEGTISADKHSLHLVLAPPGLASGHASIVLDRPGEVSGKTRWRAKDTGDFGTTHESALGAEGIDLVFRPASESETHEAGAALENLRAVTIVSLGGRGTTKLTVMATPGERKIFEAVLPESAKLFRAAAGKEGFAPDKVRKGNIVRLPLTQKSRVELAYTFETTRMGVRGEWHVDLPKLSAEAQGASWDVWLPQGLEYHSGQSSMAKKSSCTIDQVDPSFSSNDRAGLCFGFAMPVLAPVAPYAEGVYRQKL